MSSANSETLNQWLLILNPLNSLPVAAFLLTIRYTAQKLLETKGPLVFLPFYLTMLLIVLLLNVQEHQ